MDNEKGALFLRKSKSGEYLYIKEGNDKILREDVGSLIISKIYLDSLLDGERDWVIVQAVGKKVV